MLRFSQLLYGLLLHIYPKDFRQAYGALMSQAFSDNLRQVQRNGIVKLGVFWLHTLIDLVFNAIGEWLTNPLFSKPFTQPVRQVAGIIALVLSWLALLWTLAFCLLVVGDPSDGTASGTFQNQIAHLIANPPGLLLLPLLIMGSSILILTRAALNGCGGRWLAWRFALVNLIACPIILGVVLGAFRMLSQIFPAQKIPDVSVWEYPLIIYIVLIPMYALLVLGLLQVQHSIAGQHREKVAIQET